MTLNFVDTGRTVVNQLVGRRIKKPSFECERAKYKSGHLKVGMVFVYTPRPTPQNTPSFEQPLHGFHGAAV